MSFHPLIVAHGLSAVARLFPVTQVRTATDRNAFIRVWHSIWFQEGYYSAESQPLVQEMAVYDSFSDDYLVRFLGFFPAGTIRFVRWNEEVGLPAMKDFELDKPWETDRIVEATLFAVPRRYRQGCLHLPSLVLMRKLARYCRDNDLEGAIMIADRRLFMSMKDRLGFPLHQIGQEKFYEGSVCYPAYINTREFFERMPGVNPFFTA